MCSEWNQLISQDKLLKRIKNCIDPNRKISLLYNFGSYGLKKRELLCPEGICAVANKILVSDFEDNRIKIFGPDGKFISTFGSKGKKIGKFFCPFAMCSLDEELWITADHSRVQVFDSYFKPIRDIPLGEFQPLGICSDLRGRILVTTSQDTILILDRYGRIIKTFGSPGKNDGQFDWPKSICCNRRNEILVADYKNHRIQFFSDGGDFIKTFNISFRPRAVYVDWNDNLIALNRDDHKIIIFNSEGITTQEIGFGKPLDLCLADRRLFVTSEDTLVGVFSN